MKALSHKNISTRKETVKFEDREVRLGGNHENAMADNGTSLDI